jgi:hypothetical protein
MALGRFVVLASVSLPGEVLTAGTGGWGNATGTAAAGHWDIGGATFVAGQVIIADSSAGSSGPQLLYQAIGAANLRPYVQGQDDVGHAALAN